MLDPKRKPSDDATDVPPPKPDLRVMCAACLGSGRKSRWSMKFGEHVEIVCGGCFGQGKLLLAHQDEPCADSVWTAMIELFDTFGIEKDPEASAYRSIDGEWVVVDATTAKRVRDL